ncbi:beta-ketoacyl-[acyl-carrier-protein] synthase family protein [Pseudomonas batumici]|uniref:beta-ketoacyl-[acyl-carrier-protein] synthase family protein n=1 Tax=Pseudomonas batumici TaxID=226910 RepID=UPI0030D38093
MSELPRIVVTGMSVLTALGEDPGTLLDNLLAGRSGIRRWSGFDREIATKIGGSMEGFEPRPRLAALADSLPDDARLRLRRTSNRLPWSTALSVLMAGRAWQNAGLFQQPPGNDGETAIVVGGHNIGQNYYFNNFRDFERDPDHIDVQFGLAGLDTDHVAVASEVLGIRGPGYSVGGACASGALALRAALNEIRYGGAERVVVLAPVLDYSPLELHALALMQAVSQRAFNDCPEQASRPFDRRREGFVPSHGGACLVLERADLALARGAEPLCEVLAVAARSDASRQPSPQEDGQVRTIQAALREARLRPEDIDFISAHATSTPLGDITEVRSIRRVFGSHRQHLKVNAPKSMLGHTCWSAPLVELVAAIAQMRAGQLHPTINLDHPDPELDFDVCAGGAVAHPVRYLLKNSFGFGGNNCVAILGRWESQP